MTLKRIGTFLVVLGLGSFILNLIGYEFQLLFWIDAFGVLAGILIRLALVVVGAGLFFVGVKQTPRRKASVSQPSVKPQ